MTDKVGRGAIGEALEEVVTTGISPYTLEVDAMGRCF
jgi:hypothetical protein